MKIEDLKKWELKKGDVEKYVKYFKDGNKKLEYDYTCVEDYCFAYLLSDNIEDGNQGNVTAMLKYNKDGSLFVDITLGNGCNGEDEDLDEDRITEYNLVDYIKNKRWESNPDFEERSEYATDIWIQVNKTLLRYGL